MTNNRTFLSFHRARNGAGYGAALLAAALLAVPAPAYAAPEDPEELEDLSLDELNDRAAALEDEYDGEVIEYTDAKERAESAAEELAEIESALDGARDRVSQLAVAQYTGSGIDPTMEFFLTSEPDTMLDGATLLQFRSEQDSQRVIDLAELQDSAADASAEADDALADAQELVDTLEERRDEVQDMITQFEAEETPAASSSGSGGGPGNGTVPDSAIGPGFNDVTPRMAAVRDEIIMEFGAPFPVGCFRPGDPQDHGSGRACDFMMSAGGAMPSDANLALGDQIADYAVANADRLGVKYVIWKQRIYDVRSGSGWTQMSDRGSITENHFDHPHVSVF